MPKQERLHCFQLFSTSADRDTLNNEVIAALNAALQLSVTYEVLPVKCLVIRPALKGQNDGKTKSGAAGTIRLSPLLEQLNAAGEWRPGLPVFLDESAYTGLLRYTGPTAGLKDPAALKALLEAHGLTLTEELRPLKMAVISGKN